MRITVAVGERVVLAMDRDPLAPSLARRDPEEHAEADVGHRVDT
jgi:hypothetical protein